jgi:integrase
MSHYPKPFFRTSRRLWYVQLDGKQINLGPDRDEAFRRYHELMARPKPAVRRCGSGDLVAVLCDAFLDWVQKHRSPATFKWYQDRLQQFVLHHPELRIAELKPFHVQEWVDTHPEHAAATKRNNIRAVKRCLAWALQLGYVDANPIAHLQAPSAGRREMVVEPEKFTMLLSFVGDEAFRDLLIVTYETGCRPQESTRVEARHVDLARSRWVFSTTESKTKSMPRVVYLSEAAAAITAKLMVKRPNGRLFLNSGGRPWKKDALSCAFDRLQVRMGKAQMKLRGVAVDERQVTTYAATLSKHKSEKGFIRPKSRAELLCEARRKLTQRKSREFAPRYSLYALRHSWATNALLRGVDSLTVAILMGHRDPSTLARVYQHLSHRPDHLLAEARRACS